MKKQKLIYCILISYLCTFSSFAQIIDTIHEKKVDHHDTFKMKKMMIPTALIVSGVILRNPAWRNQLLDFKNQLFGTSFSTKIDDYIQYIPIVQTLGGKTIGIESKHGYKQIITNQIVSNAISAAIVHGLKNSVGDLRPDGSAKNSFPSGHAATAFTNAMLQYLEYKDSNKWYAASGFLFATATGVLRVANTRHWPGDVAAGAGIGMASAIVVHYWSPFKWDQTKKDKRMSYIAYPILNEKTYGLGFIGKLD
ncbi:phosphatase PAP2 family protein [Flavobacterium columnare]|uniref:Phosphatase PAP2 family protein n=1 Tax=Flavobacterium columnare TaxID=996 RepID=A0AA94JM28_9FLAO|nr:phosphatase PAP2 family protein [Flavobacterium columnare]MCH4829494.1 phosphatase PAP2 family protein [Flavobacterium columnare]MCH4831512.1 phosphatase PAP2 family protein [Flavobacterium columnare]